MSSFLNIIDLTTGHQIRAAEFGFLAEKPSFYRDGICFYKDGQQMFLSLISGRVEPLTTDSAITETADKPELHYLSEQTDGIFYCELVYENRVIARFMGNAGSVSETPLSADRKRIVFFGYPPSVGTSWQ